MKKAWIAVIAPPAIVLFVWLFGQIVMRLWNWLLPGLFGWHAITFWQALGLIVLCRILFGGFGNSGGRGGHKRGRGRERWESLTPEEREAFQRSMRGPCGPFQAPGSETREPA
jgi:hypothetical protein